MFVQNRRTGLGDTYPDSDVANFVVQALQVTPGASYSGTQAAAANYGIPASQFARVVQNNQSTLIAFFGYDNAVALGWVMAPAPAPSPVYAPVPPPPSSTPVNSPSPVQGYSDAQVLTAYITYFQLSPKPCGEWNMQNNAIPGYFVTDAQSARVMASPDMRAIINATTPDDVIANGLINYINGTVRDVINTVLSKGYGYSASGAIVYTPMEIMMGLIDNQLKYAWNTTPSIYQRVLSRADVQGAIAAFKNAADAAVNTGTNPPISAPVPTVSPTPVQSPTPSPAHAQVSYTDDQVAATLIASMNQRLPGVTLQQIFQLAHDQYGIGNEQMQRVTNRVDFKSAVAAFNGGSTTSGDLNDPGNVTAWNDNQLAAALIQAIKSTPGVTVLQLRTNAMNLYGLAAETVDRVIARADVQAAISQYILHTSGGGAVTPAGSSSGGALIPIAIAAAFAFLGN